MPHGQEAPQAVEPKADYGGVTIRIPKHLSWATVGGFIALVAVVVGGWITINNAIVNLQASTQVEKDNRTIAVDQLRALVQEEVNQRLVADQRLWDRVNVNSAEIQSLREINAGFRAEVSAMRTDIARILNILEDFRNPGASR